MAQKGKVAIIGDGNVGTALKTGLENNGYEVKSVGKDANKVKELAQWGECIILAVPATERKNAVDEMGGAYKGKPLIDVTNIVDKDYNFAGDIKKSGAEELQEMAKEAKVVKAFNTVFAPNMRRGEVNGERLTLFYAGDDKTAKERVRELGMAIGFDPVDAGPLKNARWLETMGFLNIQLGFAQEMGTDVGFRYVHPKMQSKKSESIATAQR